MGSSSPTVEVVLLSATGGRLRYRVRRQRLDAGVHPDDLARRLSGLTVCTPGAVLHSTSWRHTDDGVVLTYAALPDPSPDGDGGDRTGGTDVAVDAMVAGAGPLTPSPAVVDAAAVAAHACRHLALLARTDDDVALAARARPDLWEPIGKLPPSCAGGLAPVALEDPGGV
jgi:hypothetical protein